MRLLRHARSVLPAAAVATSVHAPRALPWLAGAAITVSVSTSRNEASAQCLGLDDVRGWLGLGGAAPVAKTGPFAGLTVLVTGSSRGLGLEFVKQLRDGGATVIATCRAPSRASALTKLGVRVESLDTTSSESVERLAAQLKKEGVVIDILINNAGIASKNHPVDPILSADLNDMTTVFSTNVIGTLRVTNAMLPLMAKSSKKQVVNLSSDLGSIHGTFTAQSAKVKAGGVASYRVSKAAGNMATRVFAAELQGTGTTVVAMSPGWVETDMGTTGGRSPPLKADKSIAGMLTVMAGLTPKDTGKFFKWDGSEVAW